ncbi:hypothetical protein WK02_27210 [Burkholderia cepacia]|nr:hypothetical protein WJ46_16730 [Burkholderia cepacia]KVQ25837.1 hypothetical protein WK02_27210 [Burkholderia cepacia]
MPCQNFSQGNAPATEQASHAADERAAFDLTDIEWLKVFERVSASIPNVFGSYVKAAAAFAREAIRMAGEARAESANETGAEVSGECFIVIGHGETDIPEAKIVTHRDDLLDAVLGMMYCPASDAPDDVRAEYAAALADEDEWAADTWSVSFEIGGIVVWHVGLHPFALPRSPAMAAEAVAYVCSASNVFAPIVRDKGAAQRLSDAHGDGKIVPLYTAPQPAQGEVRVGLTDALRRAREELSIVDWENDPPSRVVKLFDEIDALLAAHLGQPEPRAEVIDDWISVTAQRPCDAGIASCDDVLAWNNDPGFPTIVEAHFVSPGFPEYTHWKRKPIGPVNAARTGASA